MKEKQLYEKIINCLNNIFSDEYLKAKLFQEEVLQVPVQKLISFLLDIEKEFSINHEDVKYSLPFAQAFANVVNRQASIERSAVFNFDKIDEQLVDTINVFMDKTNYEKSFFKEEHKISEAIIKKNGKLEQSLIEDIISKKEKTVKAEKVEPKQQKNFNGTDNNSGANFGSPFFTGIPGGMANAANFPQHPNQNECFFPYTHKYKHMELLKKIIVAFSIVMLISFSAYLIYGLTQSIRLGSYDVITSGDNKGKLVPPSYADQYSATQHQITYGFVSVNSMFFLLLIVIPSIYLPVNFSKKDSMLREKYILSNWKIGAFLAIYAFGFYYLISTIMISNITDLFSKWYYNPGGNSQDYISAMTNDIDSMKKALENSSLFFGYKIIVSVVLASMGVLICLFTFGLIVNPRLDRAKVMKAQMEYNKALEATFRGEEYEIDKSIFDKDLMKEKEERDSKAATAYEKDS